MIFSFFSRRYSDFSNNVMTYSITIHKVYYISYIIFSFYYHRLIWLIGCALTGLRPSTLVDFGKKLHTFTKYCPPASVFSTIDISAALVVHSGFLTFISFSPLLD